MDGLLCPFVHALLEEHKQSIPRFDWVSTSLNRTRGWIASYPPDKNRPPIVEEGFTGCTIILLLSDVTEEEAEELLRQTEREGTPLGHRICSYLEIPHTPPHYCGTLVESVFEIGRFNDALF